jgi:hypothetical protein
VGIVHGLILTAQAQDLTELAQALGVLGLMILIPV